MKKTIVIAAIVIAAVAIPAWRYATSSPQTTDSRSMLAPDTDQDRTAPTRSNANRPARSATKQSDSAAQGLALARIEDPAERDAALARWVAGFTTNDEIVALIAALRAEPRSTASLRALIAPHLTHQWATVDGSACIAAYLSEGGLYRRDPLDSNNNPFAKRDDDTTTQASKLFTIIAETNPSAFNAWLKSAPADLIPALLGDFNSATWRAWAAADQSGGMAIRDIEPMVAIEFSNSDFSNLLAALEPDLLLRPALDCLDLGLNGRYYDGLMATLADNDAFSTALLKTHTPDQLWDIFGKVTDLGHDPTEISRTAFLKLAMLEIASNKSSIEDRAAAAAALPADYRQAATFTALLNSLDPAAGDDYWTGVNSIAKAINDTAPKSDTAIGLALINSYSELRGRIATMLAKENIDEALTWAGSIRDQRNRASCLMQIAAQEIKPGINAWASGELGVEEADEKITLHFEDRGIDPPRINEFTLPSVTGETLPQYYARLRAAFEYELELKPATPGH